MTTIKNITLNCKTTGTMGGTVTVSGVAKNITGYNIRFTVKDKKVGGNIIIPPLSGTVVSGVAGTYSIPYTIENTDVTPGNYWFDVVIFKSDNTDRDIVCKGACEMSYNITD